MELLGFGVVFQLLVCCVVGVRLLLLACRSRELPDLAFGLAFVSLGGVGYPLSIVARTGHAEGWVLSVALGAQDLACLSMFLGSWAVFRPRSLAPGAPAVALLAAFAASLSAPWWSSAGEAARDAGAWYYLGFAGRLSCFAWATVESLRFYRMMRRRLGLSLADPVLVDRFLLWSICNASITLGFMVFLVGRLTTQNVGEAPWVLAATSVVGLVAGAAMWLVFFAPAWYLRRFEASRSWWHQSA